MKFFNIVLIRYNEIWLKSKKVKSRLIKTLTENIVFSLKKNNIQYHKYQFSKDFARILFFFNKEDIPRAIQALKNVFGIHSISPAFRTSSKLNNIVERLLEFSTEVLEENDTFAIRSRRSGTHAFTSQDVAEKCGEVILNNFTHLNVKVNLSSPQKKFFIEVRGDFTYIFTEIIRSNWGGLPIENFKHILSVNIGRTTDLLSTFLLMRRGCKIHPIYFDISNSETFIKIIQEEGKVLGNYYNSNNLTIYVVDFYQILKWIYESIEEKEYICTLCNITRLKIIASLLQSEDYLSKIRIRGMTYGVNLTDIGCCPNLIDLEVLSFTYKYFILPTFTPCIGLKSEEIERKVQKISSDIKDKKYCPHCPKNQVFNFKKALSLINSIKLDELVSNAVNNLQRIALNS